MGLTKKELAAWLRAAKAEDEKVLEKARQLAYKHLVEEPEERIRYVVRCDSEHKYPVSCSCPQNRFRGKICKHMVMSFILAYKKELKLHSKKWAQWFNELDKAIEAEMEKRRKEFKDFVELGA